MTSQAGEFGALLYAFLGDGSDGVSCSKGSDENEWSSTIFDDLAEFVRGIGCLHMEIEVEMRGEMPSITIRDMVFEDQK